MADQDFERLDASEEVADAICKLMDVAAIVDGLFFSEVVSLNGSERTAAIEAHNSVVTAVQKFARLTIEMQPSVDAAKARIDRIKREEG